MNLKKANIAFKYGTIYYLNMVAYSLSIWYHILFQYGTIISNEMVAYSQATSLILNFKAFKTFLQYYPFFVFKMSIPYFV